MKTLKLHWLLASLSCIGLANVALADDSLRCDSRLVSVGDGKDKVRALCGEPTSVNPAGVVRSGGYVYGPYDYSYFGPTWAEVPVEVWTYNFGSSRLLRKLRFIGDGLVEIRSEGYGY
jgi:hypothetical protein